MTAGVQDDRLEYTLQEMLWQGGTETKKRKIPAGTSGTSRHRKAWLCRLQAFLPFRTCLRACTRVNGKIQTVCTSEIVAQDIRMDAHFWKSTPPP